MKTGLVSKTFLGALILSSVTMIGCSSSSDSKAAASTTDLSQVGKSAAGKTLICTSTTTGGSPTNTNAYVTYGANAFIAVTQEIVALVGAELGGSNGTTNLGTSFGTAGTGTLPANVDDLTTFEGKLNAFLAYQYGGPSYSNYPVSTSPAISVAFDGIQGMQEAHKGFAITASQYNYFITNMVVAALTNKGVTGPDITSCFAPVVSDTNFVASIVGQ